MNALQSPIQALRDALSRSQSIDEKTRDSLQALQHEIEAFLEAHDDRSVQQRLEKLAVRFENDHPAVGQALRQAMDALSKAGM
jgi:hypothetical protein